MNVVGKIFTVLLFIMCISFCTFALMVEAAHKVWRDNVEAKGGLKAQLDEAEKERATLTEQKKQLETRVLEETDRHVRRLAALEQWSGDLTKEREANNNILKEKQAGLEGIVKSIEEDHATIEALHAQEIKAHADAKLAAEERRQTFEKLLLVNDDLLNAVGERLRLTKLGRELGAQLAKLRPLIP